VREEFKVMALTRSQLQAKRDAIIDAITQNKQTVTFNGRSVTYRSIGEMKDALSVIDAELSKTASTTGSSGSFTLGSFRKSQ
jgi:hypothetical protein